MQKLITKLARFIFLFTVLLSVSIYSQTTSFTYQGNLNDGSLPANGSYDFEFSLYDALSGGAQIGSTLTKTDVAVAEGVFSVSLDFGGEFPGAGRWLEIRVKQSTPAAVGGFTTLAPRQAVSSAPYAIKSLTAENAITADSAATATNATQLGGISAGQFVITTDPRLSDARTPVPGSADYVQNGTTQQALSDFNISGTGTASKFNASAQYNLSGVRILSNSGTENLFVGTGAGTLNTGDSNTFAGSGAGSANTSGNQNTFFGRSAGSSNTTGNFNAVFGSSAGLNLTSNSNAFFGSAAGFQNTSGSSNSFFGATSGVENTMGAFNAFFGIAAGFLNETGSNNTFLGRQAGLGNRTGSNNTLLGASANVGSDTLTFATAIGSGAVVTAPNTIQLGRNNLDIVRIGMLGTGGTTFLCRNANSEITGCTGSGGFVLDTDPRLSDARTPLPGSADYIQNGTIQQALSDFNISGTGTASKFDASVQYNLGGVRILSNAGNANLFVGAGTGTVNTGEENTFVGSGAGLGNTAGSQNTFFGRSAGAANSTASANSFYGFEAGLLTTTGLGNSFFGTLAGTSNITGGFNSVFGLNAGYNLDSSDNSFFGSSAGFNTTSGDRNSFFGRNAGQRNITGSLNTFFGDFSGYKNTSGSLNAFFGSDAGGENTAGLQNSFFGGNAGITNTLGSNNSAFGNQSDVGSNNLTYATAIGAGAIVTATNTIQLGRVDFDRVRVGRLGGAGATVLCQNTLKEIAGCSQTFISAGDPRLTDARPPTPGSGNYIQNTTTPQATSNFSISGTGRANIFSADAQFNIGANRMLANAGISNIFAGQFAGSQNSTGSGNSMFGYSAGKVKSSGFANSFFGKDAGKENTDADNNSFFGHSSGSATTTGSANSFFGRDAGLLNTNGFANSFFGFDAGESNTGGSRLTVLGVNADVGSGDLFNATAIGAESQVDTSNSLVLGSVQGFNNAFVSVNVGIGTTSPTKSLHIAANSGRILFGDAGCGTGVTAIGFASTLSGCADYALAGNGTSTFINRPTGGSVFIRENNITQVRINSGGTVEIVTLGSGGLTGLCRNPSNEISTCSSSIRYKSNVTSFTPGLELIKKLRPVSFNWTEGGMLDVGLVAEEVAGVEPLLTTMSNGEVEGVKYDRVGVVLVNAVKEQQAQIEAQDEKAKKQELEIDRLRNEVESLKAIVCSLKPKAAVCLKTEN